jgi:hypothetical protein
VQKMRRLVAMVDSGIRRKSNTTRGKMCHGYPRRVQRFA